MEDGRCTGDSVIYVVRPEDQMSGVIGRSRLSTGAMGSVNNPACLMSLGILYSEKFL